QPSSPTPQIAESILLVPEDTGDHLVPFQCKNVPLFPTTQRLSSEGPHTPTRSFPCGNGFTQHHPSTLHIGSSWEGPPSWGAASDSMAASTEPPPPPQPVMKNCSAKSRNRNRRHNFP